MLGHLTGLKVGDKYSYDWLISTMNLQVGLRVRVWVWSLGIRVEGFWAGRGGGEGGGFVLGAGDCGAGCLPARGSRLDETFGKAVSRAKVDEWTSWG